MRKSRASNSSFSPDFRSVSIPLFITSLIRLIAKGALLDSFLANSIVVSSSFSIGTTTSARPIRSASLALILSPVKIILFASLSPTRLGSTCVPPQPGIKPLSISGCPSSEFSEAYMKSHLIASSFPPPRA